MLPFERETDFNKKKLIFKWIGGAINDDSTLNETEKIKNITVYLDKLSNPENKNSFLRFREIDNHILMNCVSTASLKLLEDFLEKHEKDNIMCHSCGKIVEKKNPIFNCSRCLLSYHTMCEIKQTVVDEEIQYDVCKNCFYYESALLLREINKF